MKRIFINVISDVKEEGLSGKVNNLINDYVEDYENYEIKDIKFSTVTDGDGENVLFSALIISSYEDAD